MVCSISMLSSMPISTAQAAELVKNDFEINYDGWYGDSADDTVELIAAAAMGYQGSRGMLVTGRTSAEEGASSQKGFYLGGGVKYDYSVRVYSETDEAFRLTLSVMDEETGEVTVKELAVKNVKAGEWTELSASYKAPRKSCDFKLTITTDSTNDFLFDDVTVTGKQPQTAHAAELGLKDEFAPYFRVGNILNGGTVNNAGIKQILLKDCNAIECENETKPDATLVASGSTNTDIKVRLNSCAAIADFCVQNNLAFRGHTMVWHSQTPEWFFKENMAGNSGSYVSSSVMDQRLESYIKNMFNAFATQYPSLNLYAYDVCNECVSDDSNRTKNNGGAREPGYGNGKSPWVQVYGSNIFVEKAFAYARQYAPSSCKLYYNDYNEYWDHKRDCIYNMCKKIYDQGNLDGVGMQSHVPANATGFAGTDSYLEAMRKYLSIGCDVQVTELDISVDSGKYSYTDQANKYKAIFKAAMDYNTSGQYKGKVTLVQVWGPNDGNSWLSAGSNALLYDSSNQPKEAYKTLTSMIPQSEWGDGSNYTGDGEVKQPELDADGYWFHYTFENGTESFSGRGSASVATSNTAYAGSKSLAVTDREDSWNGATHSLNARPFTPGEAFSFSANIMYDAGPATDTFHFTIQYDGADGETHYEKIATETAIKGEWVQLANTEFTIPAGASNMQIYFETEDSTTSFYVDEVIGAPKGTKIAGAGPGTSATFLLGDVNCDGKVTSADLSALKLGISKGVYVNAIGEANADVDQSRKVDKADAEALRDFLLTKIKEFPVAEPEADVVDFAAMEKKFNGVQMATSLKKDNENNPMSTQRFGADPGWMVYKDRLYIYTTNDAFEYDGNGNIKENSYDVGTINCVSSADLVNWTDHGAIPVAGRNGRTQNGAASWAYASWAPDACWKTINGKDKFFLYFANSGGGIGVLTADNPTGPWTDPIGKALLTGGSPNCSDVVWMFDPGVYYDPETDEAYLFFGGGVDNRDKANPKTGRVVKLGKDMISLDGSPVTMETPYLFEDSSVIKIGDTWYYSYCSNWNVPGNTNINGVSFNSADICYMTSKNPLGPWTGSQMKGMVFRNTGAQGIDNGGNNHHSIIEFKGEYYVAYHSRQQEMRMNGGKDRNYRSTQINKATYNPADGTLTCTGDMGGTSQLETLNPYQTVQAETMANQAGIQIKGLGDTVVTDIQAGDWVKVKGVEFSGGCKTMTVRASSKSGAVIKVMDSKGTAFAYAEIPAGGQMTDITVACNSITGVNDITFEFSGEMEFDSWSFAK